MEGILTFPDGPETPFLQEASPLVPLQEMLVLLSDPPPMILEQVLMADEAYLTVFAVLDVFPLFG